MPDTSVKKVCAAYSPTGTMGQKYLVSGIHLDMRLWSAEPEGEVTAGSRRDYEIVGFVLEGRAELEVEGQTVVLEPGDSWLIPRQAHHSYRILEPFTAVEATSPPARIQGRDQPTGGQR